ncbi:MAG: glutamate synthase [Phycisphaerales bacterium]|nr:glutamate synthase [Phycisphaerales bacterium]
MVDLVCTPFADHVVRMHRELATQDAVYDLPRSKWFVPDPAGPDLSVRFHEHVAANPVGPAAGPHGQMAQNLVLSYLAGGRILELKTVQVNDRLTIPRPCIDATNIGYNVEWSQELRLTESLHEYVSGAMLVHIIRAGGFFPNVDLTGPLGAVIYDMSVGYDLAGIQSPTVRTFIEGMLDARAYVDRFRAEIPDEFRHLRDLDYPTRLSDTITLSTFHGCPADEIEKICEHLINEYGIGVIIKMNPPMLGKERLEHLLHDVMGYDEIRVNPKAYSSGLQFDESVEIVHRLDALAKTNGRRCGAKFSNTLEVLNHRKFFRPDNEIMYLSGQPLYVITLALTAAFREAVGPDIPISYSAGIDQKNFPDIVACNIKPVTTCTDLLRPGGYSRLPKYLHRLSEDMTRLGAKNIDEYILARHAVMKGNECGTGLPAGRDRLENGSHSETPLANTTSENTPAVAGWQNTTPIATAAAADPRYHAASNSAAPKRINSHLVIFDCITCDKCIPVCPNDANFTYPLAEQDFEYTNYAITVDGAITPAGDAQHFTTQRSMQIANFADYCNECGNCDTFCPEYGGPFIEKPTFFGSRAQWQEHKTHDGFHVERTTSADTIHGRIKGEESTLTVARDQASPRYAFSTKCVTVTFNESYAPLSVGMQPSMNAPAKVDMHTFHTLRLLLQGILDKKRINPINAR